MNIDNIPTSKRAAIVEAYDRGDFSCVKEILSEYKVTHCQSCDANKLIVDWFGYVKQHFPEWIEGKNINK